jgi:hypothetical protein
VAGTWRALLLTLIRVEFGIWARADMMNRILVFGSCTVCHAWYFLKWWCFTPCRFPATDRSPLFKNLAVDGKSGSTIRDTISRAIEHALKIMKTYFHLAKPVVM